MTDRERLIELLNQADDKCAETRNCEGCVGYSKGKDCVKHIFADYLLDNGVIVPPCKVGDTVYFLDVRSLAIHKLKVATILISSPKAILLHLTDGNLHGAYDFGISLFHTDEEAEEAIKKYFLQKGM